MLSSLFIILLLSPAASAHIIVDEVTNSHVQLAECAQYVSRRYMNQMTNTLVVKERCNTCQLQVQNFNRRLLDHFLQNLNAAMAVQLFLGSNEDQPWNYYIFIVDNLKAFNDIRFHIPTTQYEREFFFLIILTNVSRRPAHQREIMLQIFQSCVSLHVLHVVIMLQENDEHNSIGFYTYFLYGERCGSIIGIRKFNQYRNGQLQHDELFPPQLTDFHQCTLNVSGVLLYPMLGFDGDTNNPEHLKEFNRLTGIDGDILLMIAENLNFKIHLNFPKEKSTINLKENSTGCFAELEAQTADIAIGGLSAIYINSSKFSTTPPYHQSPFIFIARTDLHFGLFKQLANPFCPTVWLAIGVTILLAFAIINVVNTYGSPVMRTFLLGSQNYYPNTNVLTIFLGNPIISPPRQNFARFLLMCWLLATLILRNSYQGKLFDSLRVSLRVPTPRGIADLLKHNYKLLSAHYVDFYPENSTLIVNDTEEQYHILETTDGRFTTVSLVEVLAHYNYVHYNTSYLSYVPEPIYSLHLAMYFQKHSVLKLIFDIRIEQLLFSGIVAHLVKPHEKREFRMMNVGIRRLPRVNNEMLRGLYYVYMILMGISFAYFILELLSLKFEKLKAFLDSDHRTIRQ